MSRSKRPPVVGIAVGVVVAAVVAVYLTRPRNNDAPAVPPQTVASRAIELEMSGQRAAAVDLLRPHLDQNPDDVEALRVFRRVLPDAEKAELAARVARCVDPDEVFGRLLDEARGDRDAASRKALLAWLKAARPDDHRWACAEIEEKVAAGQYAAAADKFRERLAVADEHGRSELVCAFAGALRKADRELEAYSAVPDEFASIALRVLAKELDAPVLASPPPAGAKERLAALVAAHRARVPTDPQLCYFDGVLLQADGEYERAAAKYAEGQAKLPPPVAKRPMPGAPQAAGGEASWDRELLRARRVECLVKLDRVMAAYAEVGPAEATFRQLAYAVQASRRADALAELVAAHKAKFPTAADVPFWEAEVLMLRGDAAGAALAFAALEKTATATERKRVIDRLIRAHLRAANVVAAARAEEADEEALHPPLRAAVMAATCDPKLEPFLAEQASRGGIARCHADEDFAREFAAARYADLRKKYPK